MLFTGGLLQSVEDGAIALDQGSGQAWRQLHKRRGGCGQDI